MIVILKNERGDWDLPRVVRTYDFDSEKATLRLTLKGRSFHDDAHLHLANVRLLHMEHNGTIQLSGLIAPASGTGEVPKPVIMEVQFGGV